MFLLAGAALLFAVGSRLVGTRQSADAAARWFDTSQVLIFAGLAADDRFRIHEALGSRLGVEDALLLGAVGLVELFLLFRFREVLPRGRATCLLIAAGLCFGCMLLIDALAPLRAPLRLSFEDLFKSWGGLMIFLFAWEVLRERMEARGFARAHADAEAPAGPPVEPIPGPTRPRQARLSSRTP